jgi:hypothetical protein
VVCRLAANHNIHHLQFRVDAASQSRTEDTVRVMLLYEAHGTHGGIYFANAALPKNHLVPSHAAFGLSAKHIKHLSILYVHRYNYTYFHVYI